MRLKVTTHGANRAEALVYECLSELTLVPSAHNPFSRASIRSSFPVIKPPRNLACGDWATF